MSTTTPEQFVRAALRDGRGATVHAEVARRFGVSLAAATRLINLVSRAEQKRKARESENLGRPGNGTPGLAPTHKGSTQRSARRPFTADQEVGDQEDAS